MSKYESLVGLVSANVESLDVERYDFFGFESWKIWRDKKGSLHLIIMQKVYSNQNSNRYFPLFNTT